MKIFVNSLYNFSCYPFPKPLSPPRLSVTAANVCAKQMREFRALLSVKSDDRVTPGGLSMTSVMSGQ